MSLKKKIKRFRQDLDIYSLTIFSSSRFLSALYYFLFCKDFRREQQSTLKGRAVYHQDLKKPKSSSAMLRRNIHRLEKGLIMRPRKEIFALDYIGETVEIYCQMADGKSYCDEEMQWAGDVLSEYFDVVKKSEVARLEERFKNHRIPFEEISNCIPYPSSKSASSNVSTDDLQQLFMKRRSRRWFIDSPIDMSVLNRAVSMASLAPSACNRQPYYFKVFTEREKIKKVSKLAMGTSGFHDNIPCLLALVGDLSAYPEERDRHVIYIDSSLAAMQLMLALETMGLGSCPINWPDVEKRERKMTKEIALEAHERVIMLIAVGTPDPEGGIPYSQKKSASLLTEVISE